MPWVNHPTEVFPKRFHLNCNGGCVDGEYDAGVIPGLGLFSLYLPSSEFVDNFLSLEKLNHFLTQIDLEPIRKEDLEVEEAKVKA